MPTSILNLRLPGVNNMHALTFKWCKKKSGIDKTRYLLQLLVGLVLMLTCPLFLFSAVKMGVHSSLHGPIDNKLRRTVWHCTFQSEPASISSSVWDGLAFQTTWTSHGHPCNCFPFVFFPLTTFEISPDNWWPGESHKSCTCEDAINPAITIWPYSVYTYPCFLLPTHPFQGQKAPFLPNIPNTLPGAIIMRSSVSFTSPVSGHNVAVYRCTW